MVTSECIKVLDAYVSCINAAGFVDCEKCAINKIKDDAASCDEVMAIAWNDLKDLEGLFAE